MEKKGAGMGLWQKTFDRYESWVSRHIMMVYVVLGVLYVVRHVLDVFILSRGSIYLLAPVYEQNMVANLLFKDGWQLRPELATVLVTGANSALVYPAGFQVLSKLLGSVQHMFAFMFIVQFFVPMLTFYFFRRMMPVLLAFPLAIFSIFSCVDVCRWAPDQIIQPLMLLALCLLFRWTDRPNGRSFFYLVAAGLLTGFMIVFKHNIGIVFLILELTFIFFQSLREGSKTRFDRFLLWIAIALYFLAGGLFARKLLYGDEFVFYLVPFFCFWGIVLTAVVRNRGWSLDVSQFARSGGTLAVSALLLPVSVFWWFGHVVGFSRYLYSLFGMGFTFLRWLDRGIWGEASFHWRAIAQHKSNIIPFVMHYLPFFVNVGAIGVLVKEVVFKKQMRLEETRKLFVMVGIAIMGIWSLFPLEGYHILSTKIFIFFGVAMYLVFRKRRNWQFLVVIFVWLYIVPLVMHMPHRPLKLVSSSWVTPSMPQIRKSVGLKLPPVLAKALDQQVMTLERSVKGRPYYVVDSSWAMLIGITGFVDNRYSQYYADMRPVLLEDPALADEIIKDCKNVPVVVVNARDYQSYLAQDPAQDKPMKKILQYVHEHFKVIDRYQEPETKSPDTDLILGFVVMERKNQGY
ncbi:MAG: hypothetical protein V2A70_01845 [Candidatus Omnitrophota bacterium]